MDVGEVATDWSEDIMSVGQWEGIYGKSKGGGKGYNQGGYNDCSYGKGSGKDNGWRDHKGGKSKGNGADAGGKSKGKGKKGKGNICYICGASDILRENAHRAPQASQSSLRSSRK